MTTPTTSTRGGRGAPVSVQWLGSLLLAASLAELAILRIGTRTAIHVPGIEQIAGPYRVFSAAGRLAFYTAVVLLASLLGYLARDLYRSRQLHIAACLLAFGIIAAGGGSGVVAGNVTSSAVAAIVFALTLAASHRQPPLIALTLILFATAFLVGATPAVLRDARLEIRSDDVQRLVWGAETLAVLAAVSAGPLVRRGIGLGWLPSRRLALVGVGTGVMVSAVLLASPSSAHILMLWNFGLTGALPAALYGLAVTSFVVAIASCLRHDQQVLALSLVFVALGGVGLTSTYQSGLVVAGLGLLTSTQVHPKLLTELPDLHRTDVRLI